MNVSYSPGQQKGFSLLELAIVLAILGILLSGILIAVSETTENTRRSQTRQQLDNILDAVYGFAQASGRLPCPAIAASNGQENCSSSHGFVPSATIGISGSINDDGLLTDAWGFPIRYSVFSPLTTEGGLASTFPIDPDNQMLIIDSGTDTITDKAAVVIVSTGANGGTTPPVPSDEEENINETDIFISTGYSEENFDDIIIWMSPYILYNRLVSAGRLP